MAYDKVVDSGKLDAAMTATANAIRAKGGSADKIDWDETTGFSFNVSKLPEPTKEVEQATPSISVDSAGKITASATQSEGYVSAGTKSATKQLTTQAAKTVTPSTTDQTAVESGRYTTGAVTVKGDANLKAENIAAGVSIWGVTGTFAPEEAPEIVQVEQAMPSITVSSGGLITASATQEAGVVSAGTKSVTEQLTTQAAKTVTPTTSNQTAVESGRYTTGAVTVKGEANLKAENIAEGVSIFGVLGTFAGGGGLSEFGGYPCETGTCVMSGGSCTIPHSLGTLKGAILMGKASGNTVVYVIVKDTFNIAMYSDGSGGNAMNNNFSDRTFWITANNTNSATIRSAVDFGTAEYSYILLGA